MNWYQFSQNNSGGSFVVDDKLCCELYIEAQNTDEANTIAERLGVYFDGVEQGLDCECCGDRWYPGHKVELPYTTADKRVLEDIVSYVQYLVDTYGRLATPDARIFYHDGTVVSIVNSTKTD